MKRTVPMHTDQESSLSVIFFSHTEHTRVSPGPHELREGAATLSEVVGAAVDLFQRPVFQEVVRRT